MEMTRAVRVGARPVPRRWWLTRRLHIDLLRVCSAFGRSA
ncbi:cell envelope biogenesis protein OmpA [Streptomyces sp. NPDC097619]